MTIGCVTGALFFFGIFVSDGEKSFKARPGYVVFRAVPGKTKVYKAPVAYVLDPNNFVASAYKPVLADNLKDRREKIVLTYDAPGYEQYTETYNNQQYKALLQEEQHPPKNKPPIRLKVKSYTTVFLSKLKEQPFFLIGGLLCLGGAWLLYRQHSTRLRMELLRELGERAGGEDSKYVGKRISEYLLVEQIGKGGQSRTYKAVIHDRFGTKREEEGVVAIKLLEDINDQRRFEKEYKILSGLNHPNVMRVFEQGTTDPSEFGEALCYTVAELIDGIEMDEITRRENIVGTDGDGKDIKEDVYNLFKPEEVSKYLKPIAAGLQHAHDHGITHRDIKPSNIMLRGGTEPVLIDFGLSKTDQEKKIERVTKTGQIFGTPAYLSPEQFSNTKDSQKHTDQYAVGVMVFHMLSGSLPHGQNSGQHFYNLQNEIPGKPLHEAAPNISKSICDVVDKMLQPKQAERYEGIQAAYEAFDKALKS
jgi:eukaryotic-like serine/threonine-protein kinase